jgi:hypothetical protein
MPGVQRIQHLARGKKLAPSCEAFSAPGARAVCGIAARKADHRTEMNNSPYLDRPLIPLAVALPRMLETIEAELADVKVSAAEKRRLRQRAELVRGLLTPDATKAA